MSTKPREAVERFLKRVYRRSPAKVELTMELIDEAVVRQSTQPLLKLRVALVRQVRAICAFHDYDLPK